MALLASDLASSAALSANRRRFLYADASSDNRTGHAALSHTTSL